MSINIGFLISLQPFPMSQNRGEGPPCEEKKSLFILSQGHVQMKRKRAEESGTMAVIYNYNPLPRMMGYIVSIKDK